MKIIDSYGKCTVVIDLVTEIFPSRDLALAYIRSLGLDTFNFEYCWAS